MAPVKSPLHLAIMQPYFLPYLGYFQLLNAADRFIVYDDVQFIRRGWINRNRMLVQGRPFLFTIPLKKKSRNTLICNMRLDMERFPTWRQKFLRTVHHAYRQAPYFDEAFPLLRQILSYEDEDLMELILHSLAVVSAYLDIDTEWLRSSQLPGDRKLSGQQRIIDICQRQSARRYINLAGGQGLYDRRAFATHGIELRFIRSLDIRYPQYGAPFVAHLSILDVLMFNDQATTRAYLDAYEWL